MISITVSRIFNDVIIIKTYGKYHTKNCFNSFCHNLISYLFIINRENSTITYQLFLFSTNYILDNFINNIIKVTSL